ncbi:MAG: PfkB family carbohydrate kinase [Acidimicrobiia bacterium]
MRVVCIGAVNHDFKAHLDAHPIAGTSNPGRVHRSVGGVAANIARNLARLEVDVALVSAVGDGPEGRAAIARLDGDGVDTSGVAVRPGASTATYLAVLDTAGELVLAVADARIIEGIDGTTLDAVGAVLSSADIWVVEANLTPHTMTHLFERRPVGTMVVADAVSALKATRLLALLPRIDVLFADLVEARALTGSTGSPGHLARLLVEAGATTAVVKQGAAGLHVVGPELDMHRPAIPPDAVVDVTGAGDSLTAGYVWGVIRGVDPVGCGLASSSLTVESDETVAAITPAALVERTRRPLPEG